MSRCALLFCLLWVASSLPVRAQESGLLLGLDVNTGSAEPYQTFWIAPQNGRVRVVLGGPDLIVPGKSGFWRTCLIDQSYEGEDGGHYESDSIVSEPATSSRAHCESEAAKEAEESDGRYHCTSTDQTRILFVGPNAISTENNWEGDCGAHPSSATTINLTSLSQRDTIAWLGITDPARRRSLRAASTDAAREEYADLGNVDTTSLDADSLPTGPTFTTDAQWAVQRGQGYWHPLGEASCSPIIACMQVSTFPVPKFRAPRQLVGHDELFPSFDTIKKVVPTARDAVSSPRRDLVVVVTDQSLLVFVPHGEKLGAAVAEFPVSGQIVMAQWATGRFVPIWTSKLRELMPAIHP